MSDNSTVAKFLERQIRKLSSVIIEEANNNPEFAAKLANVLGQTPEPRHPGPAEKPKPCALNPVDILHREGKDVLQRQLELRTDTELKAILRQQGLWKRKGDKLLFNRSEAVQTIIANAESRLHQGSSFLQSGPPQPS